MALFEATQSVDLSTLQDVSSAHTTADTRIRVASSVMNGARRRAASVKRPANVPSDSGASNNTATPHEHVRGGCADGSSNTPRPL